MKDEDAERLRSLFKPTSAFDPPWIPSPEELADRLAAPTPEWKETTSRATQKLTRIASLIEDALATTTDTDLIPLLEEALEEARA